MKRLKCAVINCPRQPIYDDDGEMVCERHAPDPHTRSWGEMRAEGIEVETMAEYQAEMRMEPEPPEPDYEDFHAYYD